MDHFESDEYLPSEKEQLDSQAQDYGSSLKAIPSSERGACSSLSEHDIQNQSRPVKSRTSSRKRKVQPGPSEQTPKKNCGTYCDSYRQLLNQEIHNIVTVTENDSHPLFPTSRFGATLWTSEEKELFFTALQFRGRHDLQGIANAVGTKSQPEVQAYLDLLRQATLKKHLHGSRQRLLGEFDVPGALEVSTRCSTALDQAAQALSLKQEKHDNSAEKRKYSTFWLIDYEHANLLDELVEADVSPEAETMTERIYRAAQLLYPINFLELSSRLFMNSSMMENNWTSYAEQQETPSVMCTAFLDFHNIVVNTTKRLISSALFFAMSRIRSTDSGTYVHKKSVRKQDVLAALDVLGMKSDLPTFWTGVARRNKLRVYHEARVKRAFSLVGEPLAYDELEKLIQESRSRTSSVAPSTSTAIESLPHETSQSNESDRSSPDGIDPKDLALSSVESNDSEPLKERLRSTSPSSHQRSESIESPDTSVDRQEAFTEAFDRIASRHEEARLWKMLGSEEHTEIKSEEEDVPKRPKYGARKSKEDLVDWKIGVDYRSPWESYGTPVPAASFLRNQILDTKRDKTTRRGRVPRLETSDELPHGKGSSDTEGGEDGKSGPDILDILDDSACDTKEVSLAPRMRKRTRKISKEFVPQETIKSEAEGYTERSSTDEEQEEVAVG